MSLASATEPWDAQGPWRPDIVDAICPWFSTLFPAWSAFSSLPEWPVVTDYNDILLDAAITVPVRFIESPSKRMLRKLKHTMLPYDSRVALEHEVMTRQRNWHDLFNLLVWSVFPQTKLALHTRQHQASQEAGAAIKALSGNGRTDEQNSLTRFDEGGGLLVCTHELAAQLTDLASKERLFARIDPASSVHPSAIQGESVSEGDSTIQGESVIQKRLATESPAYGDMRAFLMGHGLFETILPQRLRICAMGLLMPVDTSFFGLSVTAQYAQIDPRLAELVAAGVMLEKDLFFGFPLDVVIALQSNCTAQEIGIVTSICSRP